MEGFLNLAWLVPIPPFLAFVAIILFLNRNKTVSALTAIGGAGLSLALGWPIAFAAFLGDHFGAASRTTASCSPSPPGATEIMVGYQVDPANALMLFMATFLLLMIFIYASGYMTFPPHLNAALYPLSAAAGQVTRATAASWRISACLPRACWG